MRAVGHALISFEDTKGARIMTDQQLIITADNITPEAIVSQNGSSNECVLICGRSEMQMAESGKREDGSKDMLIFEDPEKLL